MSKALTHSWFGGYQDSRLCGPSDLDRGRVEDMCATVAHVVDIARGPLGSLHDVVPSDLDVVEGHVAVRRIHGTRERLYSHMAASSSEYTCVSVVRLIGRDSNSNRPSPSQST